MKLLGLEANPRVSEEQVSDEPHLIPGTLYGLGTARSDAGVVVVPVPFDATTTYGSGTADGPSAVLKASTQVDLHDHRLGQVYERGLFMESEDPDIRDRSVRARRLAAPILERAQTLPAEADVAREIDELCHAVNRMVAARVRSILDEGKTPAVLGGEHSVSFGAIQSVAEQFGEIGVLQIDAHMDLRRAYTGLTWSHASVMYNALERIPGVTKLVQVGIRDYDIGEREYAESLGSRIKTWYDDDLFDAGERGQRTLFSRVLDGLPEHLYITFDIDGLDAMLCPNTGTPVPGGLSFREVSLLLGMIWEAARAGRTRVVGFDLVEVCPGVGEWDANVGARVLYKLCGLTRAADSQG